MNSINISKLFYQALNCKENEPAVLESGNPEWCYYFAEEIKDADKKALFEVVLNSKNNHWIKEFYNNIDFDKSEYGKYMMFF